METGSQVATPRNNINNDLRRIIIWSNDSHGEARAFSSRAIDAPILIVRLWSIETSSVSLLRFLFSSSREESIFKRDDRNGRRADDRLAFLATEEILPARGARERVLRYIKGVLQYNNA